MCVLILEQIRCPQCNRRLVDLKGQAQIRCSKCKALIEVDTETRKMFIVEKPHNKTKTYTK